MDRIKVLKDIIHDNDPDYTAEASEADLDSFAREINQLYEPQPDQSRLLTVEESVKAYNAGYAGDVVAYLLTDEERMRKANGNRAILEAQRDLTASIKDAELSKLLGTAREVYNRGRADQKTIDDARIEALIEWLFEDCDCPMRELPTYQPSRPRHKCWKCMKKLKANPTSEVEG